MHRLGRACLFGFVVAGAQVLGIGVASRLVEVLAVWVPPLVLLAWLLPCAAVLGAPLIVHNALTESSVAPGAPLRRTMFLAAGGFTVGHFVGAMFEHGHFRGGGWQSLVGAFIGSMVVTAVGNLRTRAESEPLALHLH